MNREEKKQATRARLLQAAIELFAEQGYDATTVAQITDRAGVAKGTFFNYYCNKENVLMEWKVRLAIEEAQATHECPGPMTPHLVAFIRRLTGHLLGPRPLALAVLQCAIGTASALGLQNEQIAQMKQALIPMFQSGQRQGEFRPDPPAEAIADIAVQTFYGALLYWGMGHGDESLEAHMVSSFEPFFHYIAA